MDYWQRFFKDFKFCANIIIHSASENYVLSHESLQSREVIFVKTEIQDETHCGVIDPFYFSINLRTFSESLSYNNCLNRKISVDSDGFICNCPSLSGKYGLADDVNLNELANNNAFISVWQTAKNKIEKCKDCEFRLMCTDCRAYIEDISNPNSKPLKCNYNPYAGKWEN